MTIIDEEKKESIKTGVINPVQRTRVGKKGKDENDSDNRESTEPGIEGDLNSDSAELRQHASDRFNTESFEKKEEESLNLGKCHGGEQTTKHKNTSVFTDVSLTGSRHVQSYLVDCHSGEAERIELSELKPGTSYTKERKKCLSDSKCLVESEYEARKGGKHICKRGIHHATNLGITKLGEDICYDTDDEAETTRREPNKFKVAEQPQPVAGERFNIQTGQTFLTNRRPKLDKLPPSGLPPLRNKRGLQKLRDDQLARHSELRRKRLICNQEVRDRQVDHREFVRNQEGNYRQRKRFLPLDVPEIPTKVRKQSKIPIPSTASKIKPASSKLPAPARSKVKSASASAKKSAKTSSKPASAKTSAKPTSTTSELTPESLLKVQKYIDGLDEVAKRELLTKMILRDDTALQTAVSAFDDPDPQPPADQAPVRWCHCGNCKPMPTEAENRCCVKRGGQCVTTKEKFNRVVMDEDVLDAAGAYRNDLYAYDHVRNNRMFRHTAYRQFILMTYGVLRAGQRKVVPSCVVLAIRQRYPSTDGQYTGFRSAPLI